MELKTADYIAHTKKWIKEVVIGLHFCPFAAKVFNDNSIRYAVVYSSSAQSLEANLLEEIRLLQADSSIATTLIVYPLAFPVFEPYLDWVMQAERLLKKHKLAVSFQLASFHPAYIFADSTDVDAANYTNRSAYAMLHVLRESAVTDAVDNYAHIDEIPSKNMALAHKKGLQFMEQLRLSCMG